MVTIPHKVYVVILGALMVTGCANLGYYMQSISGHMEVMRKSRPIEDWLTDPGTSPQLAQRLGLGVEIRDFASRSLGLPDNDSYRLYADLDRAYVVWNVFAAPELSLQPTQWCLLVVGCVAYRGYYAQEDAERLARRLRADGLDVYVAGVPAYSTLGWFDDPLLNTVIEQPEVDLAALIFHELAHQVVFIKGDSAFNESFATVVENEGVRRWVAARGNPDQLATYRLKQQRRQQWVDLVMGYRARLAEVYGSDADVVSQRAQKRQLFDGLREDLRYLWRAWGVDETRAERYAKSLNNAYVVSVGTYYEHVPALERLLAIHGGDLAAFYAAAGKLARLAHDERRVALNTLL